VVVDIVNGFVVKLGGPEGGRRRSEQVWEEVPNGWQS
jgi:hypothetical protein